MIIRSEVGNYEWFATPDKINVYFEELNKKIYADWREGDAIPFLLLQNKMIIGEPKGTHADLLESDEYGDLVDVRGRLWFIKEVVVAWEDMMSYQAKLLVEAVKKRYKIDISNFWFLQDMSFINSNESNVYGIPMCDFISQNIYASELKELYQQQESKYKKNDEEDEVSAQFAYNGVSGRLGKYLTTTWGDSVEHANKTVILTEEQLNNFVKKNDNANS